jgi:adenosine deaminase
MPSPRRIAALTASLLTAALIVPVVATAAPAGDTERTAQYLESVRAQPAKLHALMLALPKGADLHNHLSGAVTTEGLIRLAVGDGLCIVTATLTAQFPPAGAPCPPGQRPAADTTTDRAFYQQVLQAWSMEGFVPGAETGHDHFFATFGKFGAATVRKGDMLAEVANINARQHVLYLETLASRQGDQVRALASQVGFDPDFAALRRKLLAGGMAQVVKGAIAETDDDFTRFNELLGCRTRTPQLGCRVAIRFDYQVGRATDPATVFTNLLLGFELQRADRRYVGVNLVQPEDNPVALRDYTLQMQMIGYLRRAYPGTHVTLHAGELTPGLVSDPADITFHIRQAVEIAGAERIGHGVSLVHEADYPGLLREMARRHVLVEAPLTSNAQILGVSGTAHPFWRYRAAGVPLALATDDPGVSRIDITNEYAFATTQYGLRYPNLRKLSRASLEHAFLPGRSLWRARDVFVRAPACRHDTPGSKRLSARCDQLLRTSRKAHAQWELERRLRVFERSVARTARR